VRHNGYVTMPEMDASDGSFAARCTSGPVVLRQAAAGWPCRRWTQETLAEALWGRPLTVAAVDTKGLVVGDSGLHLSHTDRFFSDRAGYLMAPFDELPPSLLRDVPEPDICRDAAFRSSKLWCAPEGAVTPLHFDLAHNLHAQLDGTKRVLLHPPWPRRALYPRPLWSGTPNFSDVDPLRPDLARHPRFAGVQLLRCLLEPGDVLYIPSGYWHHVTSVQQSMSVNFWWARGWLGGVARAADWWKRRRGLSR